MMSYTLCDRGELCTQVHAEEKDTLIGIFKLQYNLPLLSLCKVRKRDKALSVWTEQVGMLPLV